MVDEYGDTVLYFRGHEASSDSSMVDEYQRDRVDVAVELAFRFLYGRWIRTEELDYNRDELRSDSSMVDEYLSLTGSSVPPGLGSDSSMVDEYIFTTNCSEKELGSDSSMVDEYQPGR